MAAPSSREIESIEGAVRSADGTRIGFVRIGTGPPLVIVPGSLSTNLDWRRVAELLSRHFACHVMDRRGRGMSGDAPVYALGREAEDIAAVLETAGPGASLLGHSFGGICALEAAIERPVRHLVLYEPPLPAAGPVAGVSLAPYRAAIAAGRLDDALELGLARFVRLPAEQIATMRQISIWLYLRGLAASWTRELEAIDALGGSVERYRVITCPVLLLLGAESAAHPFHEATAALARGLPDAHVTILPGQAHGANRLAPDLVADEVAAFLSR
jgi:pimeloyl-ACP methyl ester carboxylesterase